MFKQQNFTDEPTGLITDQQNLKPQDVAFSLKYCSACDLDNHRVITRHSKYTQVKTAATPSIQAANKWINVQVEILYGEGRQRC